MLTWLAVGLGALGTLWLVEGVVMLLSYRSLVRTGLPLAEEERTISSGGVR
jgi:hypothetical protein